MRLVHLSRKKRFQNHAKKFLSDGRFTWNSGMFIFKASTIINELEQFCPEIVSSCRTALDQEESDLEFLRLEKEAFAKCPNS